VNPLIGPQDSDGNQALSIFVTASATSSGNNLVGTYTWQLTLITTIKDQYLTPKSITAFIDTQTSFDVTAVGTGTVALLPNSIINNFLTLYPIRPGYATLEVYATVAD
jgi:hypothetical protein